MWNKLTCALLRCAIITLAFATVPAMAYTGQELAKRAKGEPHRGAGYCA